MTKVKEYVYCVKKISCKNLQTGACSKEIVYDTFEDPIKAYQLFKKLGGYPSYKVEALEVEKELKAGEKAKKYKFAIINEFNPEDLFSELTFDSYKEAKGPSLSESVVYIGCYPEILPLEEEFIKKQMEKINQIVME